MYMLPSFNPYFAQNPLLLMLRYANTQNNLRRRPRYD